MSDPSDFLQRIDSLRVETQKLLGIEHQSELGQFFTPPAVAKAMAGMFSSFPAVVHLLDPGAGVGTLTAAFVSSALSSSLKPDSIKVTAFEIDPNLVSALRLTLEACQAFGHEHQVDFKYEIIVDDFISSSVELLSGKNTLFEVEQPDYNFAIFNPPYKKINSESKTRHLLNAIGIETTNLYTAFLWLVMKLLAPGGDLVAIIPRSFCNGVYFRSFREDLLNTMRINQIHIYDARDKAFEEGNVLQENIILYASKTSQGEKPVLISSSNDPEDENIRIREINFSQLVHPNDPEHFIRIVPDKLGYHISQQINSLSTSLKDLGLTVSTGRVVDFRSRHLIKEEPDTEIIPLIYPGNIKNGEVIWPRNSGKKPAYLASAPEVEFLAVPAQFYVLVKRFSSKEERRRIYAALFNPKKIPGKRVGFENHINYFHTRYGGLSIDLAKGLVAYLNSTLIDQYFRQFRGHTQVNATDLRNIKYPSERQLIAIGKRIADEFPIQDKIDDLIEEELALIQHGIHT
jgi:adenine-specific DNA-methyltransferase